MRRWQTDGYEGMPYVDYYVARLWEDLLQLLPAVLGPVPADLVPFIEADSTGWRQSRGSLAETRLMITNGASDAEAKAEASVRVGG